MEIVLAIFMLLLAIALATNEQVKILGEMEECEDE